MKKHSLVVPSTVSTGTDTGTKVARAEKTSPVVTGENGLTNTTYVRTNTPDGPGKGTSAARYAKASPGSNQVVGAGKELKTGKAMKDDQNTLGPTSLAIAKPVRGRKK